MANPWKAADIPFNYTSQDSIPIVFVKKNAAGLPIDNTGNTYKFSAHSEPGPASETGQLFELSGAAGGVSGTITMSPVAGANGTFGTTVFLLGVIFYDLVEFAAGVQRTLARGAITVDPRITDKAVP
jgi:hypothetical protein